MGLLFYLFLDIIQTDMGLLLFMLCCIYILWQILRDKAESRLKSAADKHWSDGALEVLLLSFDFFLYIALLSYNTEL